MAKTHDGDDQSPVEAYLIELEQSPGWKLVKNRVDAELSAKRLRLEAQHCDERATQFIRGNIEMLRMLLDLPEIIKEQHKGAR